MLLTIKKEKDFVYSYDFIECTGCSIEKTHDGAILKAEYYLPCRAPVEIDMNNVLEVSVDTPISIKF